MENNINNYNSLLNELYKFYNEIKNYVFSYFEEKNDKELLEIDFYKDFVISNNLKDRFILYDNDSQKFLLSIPAGISKYNEMKNIIVKCSENIELTDLVNQELKKLSLRK